MNTQVHRHFLHHDVLPPPISAPLNCSSRSPNPESMHTHHPLHPVMWSMSHTVRSISMESKTMLSSLASNSWKRPATDRISSKSSPPSCSQPTETFQSKSRSLVYQYLLLLTFCSSANPAALLSSRLTQYMKRPWTALSPCPIAKELIPVHPRKVFFYLTTQPRGELPTNSDDIIPPVLADLKRLTPSISDPSIADDEAEMEHRERMRFSPSPEVELFSPELHAVGAGSIPVRQSSFEEQVGSLHSIPEMPAPLQHTHHSTLR